MTGTPIDLDSLEWNERAWFHDLGKAEEVDELLSEDIAEYRSWAGVERGDER